MFLKKCVLEMTTSSSPLYTLPTFIKKKFNLQNIYMKIIKTIFNYLIIFVKQNAKQDNIIIRFTF